MPLPLPLPSFLYAWRTQELHLILLDCVWNVMAHAQKPDLVFRRNGRVHLNRWGRQFSRLLAAEVCASAVVMRDTPCSEIAWEYWLPTPFASFPFTSRPVRHRVPSGFNWTLPYLTTCLHTISRYTLKQLTNTIHAVYKITLILTLEVDILLQCAKACVGGLL
jgi:hypothetical protein